MFKIESVVNGSSEEVMSYNEQQIGNLGEIIKPETIKEEIMDEPFLNYFQKIEQEDNDDDEIKNVLLSPTNNTNLNQILETPTFDYENIPNSPVSSEPKAEYSKTNFEPLEKTKENSGNFEIKSVKIKTSQNNDKKEFELIKAMIEPCHHFPYVHLKVLNNFGKVNSSKQSRPQKTRKSKRAPKRKYIKTYKRRKYKPRATVSELTCSVCNYIAPSPSYLIAHMRKHTGEKPFSCQKCQKSFTFRNYLKSHKCKIIKVPAKSSNASVTIIKKKYICPICRRICSHQSSFDYHLRGHSGVKPYPCKFCDKTFRKPSDLKIHLVFRHSENPEVQNTPDFDHYKAIVDRRYKTPRAKKPRKKETRPKPWKKYDCKTCGRILTCHDTLKRHRENRVCQRVLLPQPPTLLNYKCSRCDLAFVDNTTRKSHEIEAHGFKFICTSSSSCGVGFNEITELEFHHRHNHPDEPKTFVCEFCALVFTTFTIRKRHLLEVHPEAKSSNTKFKNKLASDLTSNKFDCDKCIESFSTLVRLKGHETRHGTKHSCTFCQGVFGHIVSLQSHMRKAHPEKVEIPVAEKKQLKCSQCVDTFTRLQTLKSHEMNHGSNLFCTFCPGGFKSLIGLTNHKRRAHSDAIRFTCTNCPIDFPTALERKAHNEEKHPEKKTNLEIIDPIPEKKMVKNSFKCSKCDLKYDTDRQRRNHERGHGDNFKCHLCPSGFKSANGLTYHKKQLHPMESRSFICKKCGLVFESIVSRYKHQVLAHDKRKNYVPPSRRISRKNRLQKEKLERAEPPPTILTDPLSTDQNSEDFIPKEEIKMEFSSEEDEDEDDRITSWVQKVTNNHRSMETATTPTDIQVSDVIPTTIIKMEN